jgi:quinol-cytochrome oxidoreductase complex cytochrome b subunit
MEGLTVASQASRAAPAEFAQYKEDVQQRGKPFFPYAMFQDTVMSARRRGGDHRPRVRLEMDDPGDHTGTGAGWLGPLYSDQADPGTISFVPRPDWYFYFLFYLLRIFKWPNTVILGTIGIRRSA